MSAYSGVMVVSPAPRLRPSLRRRGPGLRVERELWESGKEVVIGVDEVGRGAWAGPITVGAAVVPQDRRVYKIRDSKLLTEGEREALFERIADWCQLWGVGHATAAECDEMGMSEAQRLAARRAMDAMGAPEAEVIVDGKWDFVGGARRIVGGDRTSLSIAAASILAKVTRDRMMRAQAGNYPGYNFEANKGYPCPVHKAALQAMGPTSIHRRSWVFMDYLMWNGLQRYHRPDPQLELPFDC
jgi:ribonuclease HII